MPVTISDIARKLNITPSAVSKILNKKGSFSEELKEKVFKTAKEMHYIPNTIAKNLQQKNSKLVGIIVPDISEIFFSGVIGSIEQELSQRGYQLFLCNSNEDPQKEIDCIEQLYAYRVSGIILATVRDKIESDDLILNPDTPVVFFDNAPETETPISVVCTDNYAAGRYAAKQLIKNNHKKIAAIMGKQNESGARDRYKGFSDVFREYGREDDFKVSFCDFKEESAYNAIKKLMDEDDYTGYFVASSKMLYGSLKAFREVGKRIPDDISIIGFDVEDPYNVLFAPITSILQSEKEMGKHCVKLLLAQIEQQTEPQKVQIPFSITDKKSVKNLS